MNNNSNSRNNNYNNNNNKGYNQNNQNINMNNMDGINNYPDISKDTRDTEEYMYPEVYQKFIPVADQLIRDMEKQYGDIVLTDDLLNRMADEGVRRSGVITMPQPQYTGYTEKNEEAIPTFNDFRYDGHRHWRDYDRGALSDIFKILFLQQVFGRRRPRWRWR